MTQIPSHELLQQNASTAQICATQFAAPASQPFASAAPATHQLCAHTAQHAFEPHSDATSPTHWPSHAVLQQNGSALQIVVAHAEQPLTSATP